MSQVSHFRSITTEISKVGQKLSLCQYFSEHHWQVLLVGGLGTNENSTDGKSIRERHQQLPLRMCCSCGSPYQRKNLTWHCIVSYKCMFVEVHSRTKATSLSYTWKKGQVLTSSSSMDHKMFQYHQNFKYLTCQMLSHCCYTWYMHCPPPIHSKHVFYLHTKL